MSRRRALVIGLGARLRGDDGLGIAVARLVAARRAFGEVADAEHVDIIEHADPTELVGLWAGVPCAIVIDAVRAGSPPGTVTVLEVGREALIEWPEWSSGGGTHGFGLAAAVALGQALGLLPERLVIVGVEPASVEPGTGLSPTVRAALTRASDAVLAALAEPLEPVEAR